MKTFQLVHIFHEGEEVCKISLTEFEIAKDPTVPREDYEAAMKLEVGDEMVIHYGGRIVQTSNLIRKEDKE